MRDLINKFLKKEKKTNQFFSTFQNLRQSTDVEKIFKSISVFSNNSEVRYVGGCIRKILNKEKIDDIDLAVNINPIEVSQSLKENEINYHETGIKHGTVTATIKNQKFEITSLRKDILTDGRHAKVEFSNDWYLDASRRDFTINSIYSDKDGNLFDPYNGKKDLENGYVNFIGNVDERIKEDYLRILRYLRFFINYSKQPHNPEIIKKLKINIGGISKLSKERLLDELRKIVSLTTLKKISKDRLILDLISVIFPELKNIKIFSKLNENQKAFLFDTDFIFLLSVMIVDGTDNVDYFLYKFNISKKNQKRIKIIDKFFKEKKNINTFSEKNMNKIFYYSGRQAVIDILQFRIINSKKFDKKLMELIKIYKDKISPIMPVRADVLMTKYKIPEGKQLGLKLKIIEDEWVKNDFKISEKQIEQIVNN